MRRACAVALVLLLSWSLPLLAAQKKSHVRATHRRPTGTLPVTTSSPQARKMFEQGMVDLENIQLERMEDDFRASVKKDPKFALGWLFVSYGATDPAEEAAARAKAKALAARTTPGEQLLITWLTGIRENDYVPAIKAMNDLLEQYPRDKRLAYIAGRFLQQHQEYDGAQKYFERALAVDPDYAAVINQLGYLYAYEFQFDKAIAAMDKYAQLLPNEPNPQDSYAEILRMAGKYDQAIVHYQQALKIDPKFTNSQLGIADTYALMGDEARARSEYQKAIAMAETDGEKSTYELQSAMTYVREKNYPEASKAFTIVAHDAHNRGLQLQESEAYRYMAMYEPDTADALQDLEKASAALGAAAGTMSKSDHDEELARVLRVRAVRAAEGGQKDVSAKAIAALADLAKSSTSSDIQKSYEGAQGVLLIEDGKYAEAVPHLEEDMRNSFSARRLITAYQKTGAADQAKALQLRLSGTNDPTFDQAMVVPALRAEMAATKAP